MRHANLALPVREWLTALLLFATCLQSGFLHAEVHAVLVGVSSYPSLPAAMHLNGPRNDVAALAQLLSSRGVVDVRVLADGVPGAMVPSHGAIVSEVKSAVARARPGDWVLIHMSGHGSQQPQNPVSARENDALDEVFLPIDIGRWDGQQGKVSNALVDDEIAVLLQPALASGVSVWAVFDMCHAGDMTKRAPMSGGLPAANGLPPVYRAVPAAVLGVPSVITGRLRKFTLAPEVAKSMTGASSTSGQLVAFYAARENEPAPEENFVTDGNAPRVHGVFSHYLIDSISHSAPGRSHFGDLITQIQLRYQRDGRLFPHPNMTGNAFLPLPF